MNNTISLNFGSNLATDNTTKSPYKPKFVKKILDSKKEYQNGNFDIVDNISNLWSFTEKTNYETGTKLDSER